MGQKIFLKQSIVNFIFNKKVYREVDRKFVLPVVLSLVSPPGDATRVGAVYLGWMMEFPAAGSTCSSFKLIRQAS